NRKATLNVAEAELEQARASASTPEEKQRVRTLEQNIQAPRQRVASETEQTKAWQAEIERLNTDLKQRTGALAELEKQKTKMEAEENALRKKAEALEPKSRAAKLSNFVRRTPLLQFINPAEKVQQDV